MHWTKNIRGDGYINIAGTVTGTIVDSKGGPRVELKNVRGETLAIVSPDALDPPETVLAGPLAAAFISPTGEVQWRAVAAWSVNRVTNRAEAIIAGDPAIGTMFIEFADGSLLGMGRRFPGTKEAIAAVRAALEEKGFVQ